MEEGESASVVKGRLRLGEAVCTSKERVGRSPYRLFSNWNYQFRVPYRSLVRGNSSIPRHI